jgi:hypothetical protein
MHGRRYLHVVAVAVLMFSAASPVKAQSPDAETRCSSKPSLRIRAARAAPTGGDGKLYSLDEVRFEGDTKLTRAELDEAAEYILREARELSPDRYDTLADVGRAPWQDRGYFRVEMTSTIEQLSHDPASEHYGVVFRVNPGRIFHAGEIRLTNSRRGEPTAIPLDELRGLIPMRRGDVFDTSKLREAFEALKERYGKAGYIDFTVEPDFEINEIDGVVNLTLRLDEEKRFVIASVKVLGLSSELEQEVRSAAPVGEPFNYEQIVKFLDDNKSSLPDGAGPQNLDIVREIAHGKAYLTFDFRSCQQSSNQNGKLSSF